MNSNVALSASPSRILVAILTALLVVVPGDAVCAASAGRILSAPPERTITFDKSKFPELALRRQFAEEAERKFNEPIRDAQGRIRYIVDFIESVADLYSSTPQPFDDLAPWEKPAMRNFARSLGA